MNVAVTTTCLLFFLHGFLALSDHRPAIARRGQLERLVRLLENRGKGPQSGGPSPGGASKPKSKDEDLLKEVNDFYELCVQDLVGNGAPSAVTSLCDVVHQLLLLMDPIVEDDIEQVCRFKDAAGTLAQCTIEKSSGQPSQPIEGTVFFKQDGSGPVTVSVKLEGFDSSDGLDVHGFHIHQHGELGNMCADAGSHFNPEGVAHGGPDDAVRHVGDLGNVREDAEGNGIVETVFTDDVISLSGAHSIVGKAVVVHETFDDLGKGGFNDSLTTGHAGARLGCCVVELMESSELEDEPVKPTVEELERCVRTETENADSIILASENLPDRTRTLLLLEVLRSLSRVLQPARQLEELLNGSNHGRNF